MCGAFCAASANDKKGLALYLSTKTFSYTVTGILLGALGGVVVISTQERTLLSLLAGGFMILYALNVLGIDFARKIYGSLPRIPVCGENGGPVAAGLLNGVMPCGPLQAMQVYALSTASALQGGLVMLAFALGTLPLMAGFGYITMRLSRSSKAGVFKVSALLVLLLGAMLVLNGLSSFIALSGASSTHAKGSGLQPTNTPIKEEYQVIKNELYASGYSPQMLKVATGKPVKWIIDVKELTWCNNAMKIPALNVTQRLHYEENIIELPAMQKGIVEYGCWMWMLRGKIVVE